MKFYDESLRHSYTVTIRQDYMGLDTQSKELPVKTEINGTIPFIDADSQVVFKDFRQEYTHKAKGSIKSEGEISYEITTPLNSQMFKTYKIMYADEIEFNECPFINDYGTYRVNSKRVFIQYTKGDGLVRFSSANFIYSQGWFILKKIINSILTKNSENVY